MTSKVLVCDDEADQAADWLKEIDAVIPKDIYSLLTPPSTEEIRDAIRVLLTRRAALAAGKNKPDSSCIFDNADILILDYDLLHVDENNTRYTGEGVARLARIFSNCGIIIVLNQYLEAQFDLGLRGHFESFADLNIDAELIARPGLWGLASDGGFRPSHWPVLSDAVASFRKRVDWLLKDNNFESSITQTLGITSQNASRLSDTAFGLLAPGATSFEDLEKTTFAEFVGTNSSTIDTRDGQKLVDLDRIAAARLASSRIKKWIDREVLGPQDVLVDIPHLLQRAPYVIDGSSDLGSWNKAATGDKANLRHIPDTAWFLASDWIMRPALWWSILEADEGFQKARASFDYSKAPDYVFAEDSSLFVPIVEAREFRAGFHNQYDNRYVKFYKGIRYSPQRRFAFGS